MLISEFAKKTGLSRDTVRFYVRLGLLRPTTNGKGGRHLYQYFTDDDVQVAQVVRVGQSLGLSLKEIAALNEERRDSTITNERLTDILREQLARLEAKAAELEAITSFVRAKITWLTTGGQRPQPHFGNCEHDV